MQVPRYFNSRTERQAISSSPAQPLQDYGYSRLTLIIFGILCAAATGIAVNFFDRVHFLNLLSQSNNQLNKAQVSLQQTHADVQFILKLSDSPINCYYLRSVTDQNLCHTHNHNLAGSSFANTG